MLSSLSNILIGIKIKIAPWKVVKRLFEDIMRDYIFWTLIFRDKLVDEATVEQIRLRTSALNSQWGRAQDMGAASFLFSHGLSLLRISSLKHGHVLL
jgi:hypothetical protein